MHEEVEKAKLLGLWFDNDFGYENHIDGLIEDLSKRLGGLKKVGKCLTEKQKKTLAVAC